jgi:hypothetical protein
MMPPYCAHCGVTLIPSDGACHYLPCSRRALPHARYDLSPNKFPITLRLHSGKTGEVLWSRSVTIDEARNLAKVQIPGYAGTDHYPVRAEIEYADGTTEVGGLS